MVTVDDYWSELGDVSPQEREALALLGYSAAYVQASADAPRRTAFVSLSRRTIDTLRAVYGSRTSKGVTSYAPADSKGQRDGRWELLRDLQETQANAGANHPPIAPLQLEYTPRGYSFAYDVPGALPGHGRVTLHFDDRLSQAALFAELKRLWPRLRDLGVPARRPLGDRKLALVRFVCLEAAVGSTWRQRCDDWNNRHPEWVYADARALQNAFNKAEASLVGRDGLRWFYDSAVRSASDAAVQELANEIRAAGETVDAMLSPESRLLLQAVGELDDDDYPSSFRLTDCTPEAQQTRERLSEAMRHISSEQRGGDTDDNQ